jgi:hypothetical protein
MIIVCSSSDLYIICRPSPNGLQVNFLGVRPQTKSPIQISLGEEIRHISLPPDLNNQPIATFAKNIFLLYV